MVVDESRQPYSLYCRIFFFPSSIALMCIDFCKNMLLLPRISLSLLSFYFFSLFPSCTYLYCSFSFRPCNPRIHHRQADRDLYFVEDIQNDNPLASPLYGNVMLFSALFNCGNRRFMSSKQIRMILSHSAIDFTLSAQSFPRFHSPPRNKRRNRIIIDKFSYFFSSNLFPSLETLI